MNNVKTLLYFFTAFVLSFTLINVFSSKVINEIPLKISGAMEALDFWNAQRAYPNKTIPSSAYYEAFEFSRKNIERINKTNGDEDEWTEIGPHNIGGRTISVAINPQNPNTIYAGSASGGLWRSYSAGEGADAWDYVPTDFPVLGVGAIAIVPDDSNTIYIGTGEVYGYQNSIGGVAVRTTRGSYGIGILKTTDGGVMWQKSLDWAYNQERGVQVLKINPQNNNTLWAGTTEGTYKSTDAGLAWQHMDSTIMVTDIIINPNDTNMVFIACGNLFSTNHGIYRTADGGSSWMKLTNGLPAIYGGKALFSVYDSSSIVLFASIGNGWWGGAGTWLCKTADNGDSWETVSTFDYATWQGWFSHFVIVNGDDPDLLLTGGVDIWKSIDGGSTFTRQSVWTAWFFGQTIPGEPEGPPHYAHADHHAYAVHPSDPNIVYFGNDGGIFKTTDFGATFAGRNGGYQTTQFYNGFTSSLTDSLLSMGGLQDNATAIFIDGTVAWFRAIGGDGSWTAINQLNNDIIYGSSQFLSLSKSTNRGLNFSNRTPPNVGVTGFIAPYVIGFDNPEVIYAGRSIVLKSTNEGTNWTETNNGISLSDNPPVSMAISYQNSDVVYVGMAPVDHRSEIFRTTDGGESWNDITGSLPDRYPMDIAVDPQNDANIVVALSGFGTSHVFKSTDWGDNWLDIGSSLPDVPTSAVAVDPVYPNHIYAGNDLGIYLSIDGGDTWNLFNEGMPDAAIIKTLSVVDVNRKIRAATHGNGAFERDLYEIPVSVAGGNANPKIFELMQNYPNPFNPSTVISYQLAVGSKVTLKVFDILGNEVATLVDEYKIAGSYETEFNANTIASGIYVYTIRAGNLTQTKKMILLR